MLFDEDSTIILEAIPDSDSSFEGWSGAGCSGTDYCSITITADTTVTATFTLAQITLTPTVPPTHTPGPYVIPEPTTPLLLGLGLLGLFGLVGRIWKKRS